jgi:small multidrug resistance pump
MQWLYLSLATLLDVAGTAIIKVERLQRPVAIVGALLCYGISTVPFMIALRKMDLGVAYAAWSALATLGVAAVGILCFRESASALKVVSVALIIAGVCLLNFSTLHR